MDSITMNTTPDLPLHELHEMLTRRLQIIGDAELRARDGAAQLAQLQAVSESISAWHQSHRASLPERLEHYLAQSSLEKARLWIEGARDGHLR
jgi:hypothetical protein